MVLFFFALTEPRTVSVLSDDVFLRSSQSSLTSSCDSDVISDDDLRVETGESSEGAGPATNKPTNLSSSSASTNKTDSKSKSRDKSKKDSPPQQQQLHLDAKVTKKKKAVPKAVEAVNTEGVGSDSKKPEVHLEKEGKVSKRPRKKRAPAPPMNVLEQEQEHNPVRRYTSTSVSSEGSYKLDAAEGSESEPEPEVENKEVVEINIDDPQEEGFYNNRNIEGFTERDEIIASYTNSDSETSSHDDDNDVIVGKTQQRDKVPDKKDDSGEESENTKKQRIVEKKAEGAMSAKKFLIGSFENVFEKSTTTTSEESETDNNRKVKKKTKTVAGVEKPKAKCDGKTKKSRKEKPLTLVTDEQLKGTQEEKMWARLELPSGPKKGEKIKAKGLKMESSSSASEESEHEVRKNEDGDVVSRSLKKDEMVVHDKKENIVLQTSTKENKRETPKVDSYCGDRDNQKKMDEPSMGSKKSLESSTSGTSDDSGSDVRRFTKKDKSQKNEEKKKGEVGGTEGAEHRKQSSVQEARLRLQKQKGLMLQDDDVINPASRANEINVVKEKQKRRDHKEEPEIKGYLDEAKDKRQAKDRSSGPHDKESKPSRKADGNFTNLSLTSRIITVLFAFTFVGLF